MQTLSPHNKGLVKRAISQSGDALSPWAVNEDPRTMPERVGHHFNLLTYLLGLIPEEKNKMEFTPWICDNLANVFLKLDWSEYSALWHLCRLPWRLVALWMRGWWPAWDHQMPGILPGPPPTSQPAPQTVRHAFSSVEQTNETIQQIDREH